MYAFGDADKLPVSLPAAISGLNLVGSIAVWISLLIYLFLGSLWAENVLGFKLTDVRGLSLLNLSFYFLLLAWAGEVIKKKTVFQASRVNATLILFMLVMITSIAVKQFIGQIPSPGLLWELSHLKGTLTPLLVFFAFYNVLNTERDCHKALRALLIFVLIAVVTAVAVSLGMISFGMRWLSGGGDRGAGFTEPNQDAAMLVLFMPLLYSQFLSPGSKTGRLFAGGFLFLAFASLVFTGSRGGAISLVAATIVYVIAATRRGFIRVGSSIFVFLVVLPLLASLALFAAPSNIRESVMTRFDPSQSQDSTELTSGRDIIWAQGFELFLENPVVGYGQATFIPLMKSRYAIWANSHNDYLLYLVHYGLIGLSLFAATLWLLLQESRRLCNMAEKPSTRMLALSYMAGLCGYAVAIFGVNIIHPQLLFWLYSAVVMKLLFIERQRLRRSAVE